MYLNRGGWLRQTRKRNLRNGLSKAGETIARDCKRHGSSTRYLLAISSVPETEMEKALTSPDISFAIAFLF